MSLKDEVRWVHKGGLIMTSSLYRDIGDSAVIPVTALRAWLEEQHTSIVGKATVAAMLVELERLS